MKYPVIYIKGRGNHTARFTELTEGQMRIAGDIGAAMGKLMPLKDDHAFILYEQQGEEDIRSIRFLRSWFPGAGIVLITSGRLTGEERRAYLGAGVNSAVPGDISRADFLRTLQFMTDYTFVRKPVAGAGNEVRLFRMPLWKRAFDIAASLSAILLLSPLLIAVAVAVRLDSPGPVIYKSKRVGSNYRIFDFLKFRSMRSDADRRLKELEDLNQYASASAAEDDAKMVLDDEEIRKLLEVTEPLVAGMLLRSDTRQAAIESNNGGRGFARSVQALAPSVRIEWFHQGANKEARILSNSATALHLVRFPRGWNLRWPELYAHLTTYRRRFRANRWHDAADVVTGIVEREAPGRNRARVIGVRFL